MKKLLAIFLSVLMLCTTIPFTAVAADADYYIELAAHAEEVSTGDEVVIDVNLYGHENVGLIDAEVELGFDPDVFELVTTYEEYDEMWIPPILMGRRYSTRYVLFPYIDEETGYMERCLARYVRLNSTATQAVKTNLFYTVTFRVKDDAKSGNYTIEVINHNDEKLLMYGNETAAWSMEPITIRVNGNDPAPEPPACEHEYEYGCSKFCSKCSEETRPEAEHEYVFACDTNCKICGETTNEEAAHYLIHVPAVEGNCITLGHGEYWYCEYCGACWGDNLLPPSPPRYGDHKYDAVTTAPTCTWEGYTTYTCSVCGDTYTETIPALGHTYDNACDNDCNICSETRIVFHAYDNTCDADCNKCGYTRIIRHLYNNACDTVCNVCGATRTIFGNTATIEFTSIDYRTAYSDDQQVWEQNGIVVTNDRGLSPVRVGDYANPGRFYKSSTVTIEYPGMTAIVIDCSDIQGKYVTGWADSVSADATAIVDGNVVTIVLSAPSDSFTWEWLSAQCRAFKFTIYTASIADHVYDNACDADCNECGAIRQAADHSYDNDCDRDCNVCGAIRQAADHSYDNACDTICNVCGATRIVPHTYSNDCDRDCNLCGATRIVPHTYSNDCDRDCNLCGATRIVPHSYDNACDNTCNLCGTKRKPADHVYDNDCDRTCNECGAIRTAITHTYTDSCDRDCNVCGMFREPPHDYANKYDEECDICGEWREVVINYGDADGDGRITLLDATMLSQHLNGWDITLDEVAADADGDGALTLLDATLLSQYLNGWNVQLG